MKKCEKASVGIYKKLVIYNESLSYTLERKASVSTLISLTVGDSGI